MKTTRQQQDATRRQIVACAVDLITRQGFDGTTMKDIARAADIGDATIYKYFPSKDRIVIGYIDDVAEMALQQALASDGFAQYTLQEKLQRLTDGVLERLLADREFVATLQQVASRAPLSLWSQPLQARERLREAVVTFLTDAEAQGEIAPCAFKVVAASFYMDYLAGIVHFWLRDTSDEFADTTQLVDLSLGILVLVLQAGLANRMMDLGRFVVRSQMARLMQHGSGLMGMLNMARSTLVAQAAQRPPAPTGPAETNSPPRRPTRKRSKAAPTADAPTPAPRSAGRPRTRKSV